MKYLSILFLFLSTITYGQKKTVEHELFTMTYSNSWEMKDGADFGAIYIFLSEPDGLADLFQENISIIKEDISNYDISLDDYLALTLEQGKIMIPDMKVISSERKKINGNEFHAISYTGTQNGYELKWLQHFHLTATHAFSLTLSTELESFDKYKDEGSAIMESIVLLNPEGQKESKEWQTVDDELYTVNYPGNWIFRENPGYGISYLFLSKQEGPKDLYQENVSVTTEDLSFIDVDLIGYVEAASGQLAAVLVDAEILSSKTMEKGNSSYHAVSYTGGQGEYQLKGLQYYFVTKDKAYVLTYTAEIDKFDKFVETAEKIMDSFKLK